jgi:hypothetical protein
MTERQRINRQVDCLLPECSANSAPSRMMAAVLGPHVSARSQHKEPPPHRGGAAGVWRPRHVGRTAYQRQTTNVGFAIWVPGFLGFSSGLPVEPGDG